MRGLKKVCVVCVFVSMRVCPSCVIPQSSTEVGLFHVCSPKLCYSKTLTLLLSPPSTFSPSVLNLSASVSLSTYHPFPSQVFHLLVLFLSLALSHTFSSDRALILVSFDPSPLCPSPSLIIGAICWRERQGVLKGWTVLYVESVVQRWSQQYRYTHACVSLVNLTLEVLCLLCLSVLPFPLCSGFL